jgi:hypothetical protein
MTYSLMWHCAVLAGAMAIAPGAESVGMNPWSVVAVREPRAGEVPFEETSGYLYPSMDANNPSGPDSLEAHMRIEGRRGHVEIQDFRAGMSGVFRIENACLPEWSPNGKYLTCSIWTPERRMGTLSVFDIDTRRVIAEARLASGNNAKWSPDSRMVLVDGVSYGGDGKILLYRMTVPEGDIAVIDTLGVPTNYEFSWSPDSRWIAFSRPTRMIHEGDATASDLWIADAERGDAWPLRITPDRVQSDPLWISNQLIQVREVVWDEEHQTTERLVVIEVHNDGGR